MRKIFFALFVLTALVSKAQNNLNLVPMPAKVKLGKGTFNIDKNTTIVLEGSGLEKTAALLNEYLLQVLGYKLKLNKSYAGNNAISLNFERLDYAYPGAYNLDVSNKEVYIAGDNENGVFYGVQTLMQLIDQPNKEGATSNANRSIPQLSISDYPRFSYRGMHFDVCRHFFPVSFVKKYIDYLAAYKFNKFHWHLTDDQGWRIEIKKYPLLTTIGANRNGTLIGRYPGKGNDNIPYGGFYTQEQIKDIIQYAKERYIEVIPEIEMPGHSSAAIAAYPWLSCFPEKPTAMPPNMMSQKSMDEQKAGRIKLVQETWGVFDDVFCAGKDSTFKFLEDVIDEVSALFPSKYIHVGGDESPKTHWEICPYCQKRIKDNNLKDAHELQSYFVQRIEKYVNSKGKTIIGWDEILEGGLAPNAVVMSWRGEAGGIEAAKQKHPVIMTPGNPVYFDHTQSKNEDSVTFGGYNPIENVYAYEPVAKELNAEQVKYILGAQANLWTEYIGYPSKVEYQLFPRITALSEVLWSPKEKRDWKDFERRLPVIFQRLDKQKINYSKAYFDLKATVEPIIGMDGYVQMKLESKFPNVKIKYKLNNGDFYGYIKPIAIRETVNLSFSILKDQEFLKISSQKFSFNKATGKKITLATEADKKYPGDGAFTLVNGVQNEKGIAKSSEFLGFNGTDLDATIDLGKEMDVSIVTVHVLEQNGSWIYLPSQIKVTFIPNGDFTDADLKNFPSTSRPVDPVAEKGTKTISVENNVKCRYVKVVIKNYGIIPTGNAGAGNPAWLFVDEIEVE